MGAALAVAVLAVGVPVWAVSRPDRSSNLATMGSSTEDAGDTGGTASTDNQIGSYLSEEHPLHLLGHLRRVEGTS